jgi:hypothetical protein
VEPDFKVRGTANIINLESNRLERNFPVRYERPGRRLALSRDDRLCFVGCYEAYGLGAYSTNDGGEIWRRKDLKSVQSVTASEVQDWVFCGRESGAAHLVDSSTGETIEKLTGVTDVFVSPFDESVAVAGRALELHRPFGTKVGTLKRSGKRGAFCCFSPSEVISSEGESLSCFDLTTGELLWSHSTIPGENHFVWASFHRELACFAAITREHRVVFFDPRLGRRVREIALTTPLGLVFDFHRSGSHLVASNLCVYHTQTGALVVDLSTPELLAWDPQARMARFTELAASGRTPEELEHYMRSEGFAKNDVERVLMMKYVHDKKQKKS